MERIIGFYCMILVDYLSTFGTPDIGITMLLKSVYDENTPPSPLPPRRDTRFSIPPFRGSAAPVATRDDFGKANEKEF